jgi:hypothetical protein
MTELHEAITRLQIVVIILGCVVVIKWAVLIFDFIFELKRIKATQWRWVK